MNPRPLAVRDLGQLRYRDALLVQRELIEQRKQGLGCDTLLFVEHPPVITMGRNGSWSHVLADAQILERAGIDLHETDRGGDATFHGPGQLVGYPIMDLREWKRDVHALFAGLEDVLISALASLGVIAKRRSQKGYEGVWVGGAKIAAIGVHISRWITSHGFALNIDTDLDYFRYIVPCGLHEPVCSLRSLGLSIERSEVMAAVTASFARIFHFQLELHKT